MIAIFVRRRKTETATVTREFVRLRRWETAITAWCRECGDETKLLPPEAAAARAGISPREVYRRVELGHLHFEEESRGSLWICLNSIDQQVSQPGNKSLPDFLVKGRND